MIKQHGNVLLRVRDDEIVVVVVLCILRQVSLLPNLLQRVDELILLHDAVGGDSVRFELPLDCARPHGQRVAGLQRIRGGQRVVVLTRE